jgi:monooxygenase
LELELEDNHFDEKADVVIIGAGLAGIGMAAKLSQACPDMKFLLLEQRDRAGGTWDLFRYPGVRSDSDMQTLGYSFKPWTEEEAIADGDAIQRYIAEAADEYGIFGNIRFGHRVTEARWQSALDCWIVLAEQTGRHVKLRFKAQFIVMCSGYYDYGEGHKPDLPGASQFCGPIIHPQQWPDDFDPADKKIVVIGSGATAVTLVPSLAKHAQLVTMLQRSPGYSASRPRVDQFNNQLRRLVGDAKAYRFVRWRNIKVQRLVYWLSTKFPKWLGNRFVRSALREMPNLNLSDDDIYPSYPPCVQRLCLTPDGEMFEAVKNGSAEIVTGQVETLTHDGIALRSGRFIPCDCIVTATGLKLALFGKVSFFIDGNPIAFPDHIYYKGAMLNEIPNFICMFGYVNISWTLRTEMIATYACRLFEFMHHNKYVVATPTITKELGETDYIIDEKIFSPGYYRRSKEIFPKNSKKHPWRILQNFNLEKKIFNIDPIRDSNMIFR